MSGQEIANRRTDGRTPIRVLVHILTCELQGVQKVLVSSTLRTDTIPTSCKCHDLCGARDKTCELQVS